MKKILNKAADFVPEMLDGLIKAHPDQLAYEEDLHCIVRADAPVQGKVALATGGGSGHLPVFLGYVGKPPRKAFWVYTRKSGHSRDRTP